MQREACRGSRVRLPRFLLPIYCSLAKKQIFLYLFIFGPNTAIIIVYFCGQVTPRWRIGSLLLMKVSRDNRKAFRKNWSWRYTSTQKKTESKHREREREKQKSNNILQREESRKRQKIKHIYGGKKSVCVCVYLTLFLATRGSRMNQKCREWILVPCRLCRTSVFFLFVFFSQGEEFRVSGALINPKKEKEKKRK